MRLPPRQERSSSCGVLLGLIWRCNGHEHRGFHRAHPWATSLACSASNGACEAADLGRICRSHLYLGPSTYLIGHGCCRSKPAFRRAPAIQTPHSSPAPQELDYYRLGERVKGTKRTGATARVVVLSGA